MTEAALSAPATPKMYCPHCYDSLYARHLRRMKRRHQQHHHRGERGLFNTTYHRPTKILHKYFTPGITDRRKTKKERKNHSVENSYVREVTFLEGKCIEIFNLIIDFLLSMGPILDALWRNMLALLNPLLKSIISITTKTTTQPLVEMIFLLMIEAVVVEEDSVNIATSKMQWVYVMLTCCCSMMAIIMVVHVPYEDVKVTHLINEELGIPNLDPPVFPRDSYAEPGDISDESANDGC